MPDDIPIHASAVMPSGLGAAAAPAMPAAPRSGPIEISPRAKISPAMLAPKVQGMTEPNETTPSWYQQVHGYLPGQAPTPVNDERQFRSGGAVHPHPSDAQKEAGNYRKGHIRFQGLDISIETAKGQRRSGKDPSGKPWHVVMPADYGYVKRTTGADGEHVDVFVGPHKDSNTVFIINQRHLHNGEFDESKVMLGYESERQAVADYCKAFSDGKGRMRIKSIETVSMDALKMWLKTKSSSGEARSKKIVDHALRRLSQRASS